MIACDPPSRAGHKLNGLLNALEVCVDPLGAERDRDRPAAAIAEKPAIALAAFGAGSMLGALALPMLLERLADRPVLFAGAIMMAVGTGLAAFVPTYTSLLLLLLLLLLWFLLGAGYSLVLTPSGRLLRRSAHPEDRPAMFAAQFALSHACWLITYPLAGWAGARLGLPIAALLLAVIAVSGIVSAMRVWSREVEVVLHHHPGLSPDHPHLADQGRNGGHAHAVVIDGLHPRWPTPELRASDLNASDRRL